ncbi:MAG: hypothetical protein HUU01_20190 [Saprospiraceae bacterium]|nr:hypothetical protein [Saprospiraceae bacterium]
MKNILSFALAAFAAILFFSACDNDKENPLPEITIESPAEGTTFEFGDTVHIEVDITHTEELHEYLAELKKVSDGTVLFSTGEHSHSTEVHVHEHWVNNVTSHSDMELVVTATDHTDKTSTKKVHFHCHPN